jgi:hypothetical protein
VARTPVLESGAVGVERSAVAEARDWAILAGMSAAGWLTVALAIGAI